MDLYVRGGLTLPKESKFDGRRALGAMIAEEEPLCNFLGDAENAAHTLWVSNSEKLIKNYRSPHSLVKVIKHSVRQLYDRLAEVTEERDEHALQTFFWFEEPKEGKKKKKRKKPRNPDPVPEIKRAKPLISITRVSSGFTVTGTEALTEDKLPHSIRVEMAYQVARGNAFKKYSPYDFNLGKKGSIGAFPRQEGGLDRSTSPSDRCMTREKWTDNGAES